MAYLRKRRRDSTRIIYEILLASKNGTSKTRAVHQSNINFHLMNKYLAFLTERKYLEQMPDGSSCDRLMLTDKGARLLGLLEELEGELKAFTTVGSKNETVDPAHSRPRATREVKNWLFVKGFLRSDQEYQVSLALIHLYSLQGQASNEETEIERMVRLAQTLSDNSKLAEAHSWKSNYLTRIGMYQQAMVEGKKALDFASTIDDKSRLSVAQLAVGEASAFLGQKDESLRYFSEALKSYQQRGDRIGQANATRLIAHVLLKHNDFASALVQANNAITLFREIGDRIGEDESLRYIGDILCVQGDFLQALDHYEQVLRIRREIGNRSREGGALGGHRRRLPLPRTVREVSRSPSPGTYDRH